MLYIYQFTLKTSQICLCDTQDLHWKMNHDQPLIDLMESLVIWGTTSWLDIDDHPYSEVDGHKKARKKSKVATNPVYRAKGDAIENATLNFLLDCQEDVITMLNERNKFQKVICKVPFSSREKFKITAITIPEDPENPNQRNMTRIIVQGAAEIVVELCQG